MENNQQRINTGTSDNEKSTSLNQQKPGEQTPRDNEAENANRFAETSSDSEQNKSRKSDAENETLGTP